jgi:hypothetical protein
LLSQLLGRWRLGGLWFQSNPGKNARPYLKDNPKAKGAESTAPVVEPLPRQREAPSSNVKTSKQTELRKIA